MQHITYIQEFSLAIVIMVLLVLIEFSFAYFKKKKVFSFKESFTNLACGLLERISFIAFAFIYYYSFTYFYSNFSLFKIPNNPFTILLLFFLVDFIWYIYHRLGHRINVLWAAHITHHQSKDYNLTVSFRVSILQLMIRLVFWCFLPILGFNPTTTLMIIGINAAYQFFIHTSLIGKMGILESFLVTPSHHRVHHGSNSVYIDKNFGGMFIIWDKLLNTFQSENETVQFGITKELGSHNPIHAWFHYFIDLLKVSYLERGLLNKLKIWFAPPESLSHYYDTKFKLNPTTKKSNYIENIPLPLKLHILFQMGWLLFTLFVTYAHIGNFPAVSTVPFFLLFYLVSILSLHELFKVKKHVGGEIIRIAATCYIFSIMGEDLIIFKHSMLLISIFLVSNLSLIYFYKNNFKRLLKI
jgi:alkylglycerol monooxygenase